MSITCKLTGKKGKGVKAHIIPAGLFVKDTSASLIIHNTKHPKRTWTGIWDSEIVTRAGEDILQELDDYAIKVFQDKSANIKSITTPKGKEVGLQLEEYDYQKFKLFCLSVLWRMSVSTLDECKGVALGPHEEVIKRMLLNNNAGEPEAYAVNMFYFFEDYTKGMVLYPVRENFDGLNYYRLHFGKFMAIVKVDSRKTPKGFESFKLTPDKPLFFIGRDYSSSSEADLFRHMSDLNQDRFPDWFQKEIAQKI